MKTKGASMKKSPKAKGHDLESMLGQRITLFCMNYFYTGRLTAVSAESVLLEEPAIVYETGSFDAKDWQDAQNLPAPWRVKRAAIESFGVLK